MKEKSLVVQGEVKRFPIKRGNTDQFLSTKDIAAVGTYILSSNESVSNTLIQP